MELNSQLPVISVPLRVPHVHGDSCDCHGHSSSKSPVFRLSLPVTTESLIKPTELHDDHTHCGGVHGESSKNNKFTPLMGRIISSKNLSPNLKELLVTGSFLSSALPVTKILGFLTKAMGLDSFTSSLITAPIAISSMHFINRGKQNLGKLGMVIASSLTGIGLQKVFKLPKVLLRSFLTIVVFFIEKYKPDNFLSQDDHVHGPDCNHEKLDHSKQKPDQKLEKKDFVRLGKTLATILSVPALLNIPLHKMTDLVDNQDNFAVKLFGHAGLTITQILGLTFGFFGFGKAFNYGVNKLGLNTNTKVINHGHNHTHGQTEGAVEVCAHCGVPGCIDSVAESVTESVESSIISELFV